MKLKLKKGQLFVITLIFVTVGLVINSVLFAKVAGFSRFGYNAIQKEQAIAVAEAGIDYALLKLNETAGNFFGETPTWVGTTGQFVIEIETINPSFKKITSTAYIPSYVGPFNPDIPQPYKVRIIADAVISSQTIAFHYATQAGNDGITMNQSSRINGNAYSNGNIVAGGGSGQTIDGDAYAVGTISAGISVTPPHQKYPNSSPVPLPDISQQKEVWKSAATAGGTTTCLPTCTITSSTSIGPRKYVGNLTITNNPFVTINGSIWVTGSLSISGGSTVVKLSDSFGSNGTGIVVDGTISITTGANIQPTSANPPGYLLLVTDSTSSTAATINNNNTLSKFILHAQQPGSRVSLQNNTNVSAIVANQLFMSNNSNLTYEQGLASASFTTGPGGAWVLKKGTYKFK